MRLTVEKELCKLERVRHRDVERQLKELITPTLPARLAKEVFAEINYRKGAAREMTARMHNITEELRQRCRH
jgi:hypothetical protein